MTRQSLSSREIWGPLPGDPCASPTRPPGTWGISPSLYKQGSQTRGEKICPRSHSQACPEPLRYPTEYISCYHMRQYIILDRSKGLMHFKGLALMLLSSMWGGQLLSQDPVICPHCSSQAGRGSWIMGREPNPHMSHPGKVSLATTLLQSRSLS